MADQNRNQQSQKQSRGQQGQQDTQSETRQTQSNQGGQQNQQSRKRDEKSTDMGGSQRERSSHEPSSTAHDRRVGNERRNMGGTEREGLEREGIESDLDSETDVDSEDIEGGGRSNR